MWFKNQDVGLDYVASAPFRFVTVRELAASPEEVFAILADGDSWPRWFPDFRRVEWTTPEPRGVGSVRHVTLKALQAKERFLAWEPGRRWSFVLYESTLPVLGAMVEDYAMEPLANGHTRLTINACYTLRWFARPIHPILRAVFGKLFAKAGDGLQEYIARGAHR